MVDFPKDKLYFEPASGMNVISNYFHDNLGIDMVTNELFDHGVSDYKEDFLYPNPLAAESWNFDIIVSNPPYKLAQEFIEEGFKYARTQFHLLRLNFLEGKKRKEDLFSQEHLKRVFIFSYRISCSKGIEQKEQANAVAYAFFEFDREYKGNPEIIWL